MRLETSSTAIETFDPFTSPERVALTGFRAGYSGLTREAHAMDLRQFATWCAEHHLALFCARRADIEGYGRELEAKARATIARRLGTVTGFYPLCGGTGTDRALARRARAQAAPGLRVPCSGTGPQRSGRVISGAGLAGARDHALVSLLCLNGLRVSEAIGADIERLALERGHRTLTIVRKGAKVVTVPLAPRTARAVDLAVGERCEGPILVGADGERLDRHAAARIMRRLARQAGIAKRVGPHTLRHAFITAALDAGVPLRDVQEAPVTRIRARPCDTTELGVSLDRHATYIVATFLTGTSR